MAKFRLIRYPKSLASAHRAFKMHRALGLTEDRKKPWAGLFLGVHAYACSKFTFGPLFSPFFNAIESPPRSTTPLRLYLVGAVPAAVVVGNVAQDDLVVGQELEDVVDALVDRAPHSLHYELGILRQVVALQDWELG